MGKERGEESTRPERAPPPPCLTAKWPRPAPPVLSRWIRKKSEVSSCAMELASEAAMTAEWGAAPKINTRGNRRTGRGVRPRRRRRRASCGPHVPPRIIVTGGATLTPEE